MITGIFLNLTQINATPNVSICFLVSALPYAAFFLHSEYICLPMLRGNSKGSTSQVKTCTLAEQGTLQMACRSPVMCRDWFTSGNLHCQCGETGLYECGHDNHQSCQMRICSHEGCFLPNHHGESYFVNIFIFLCRVICATQKIAGSIKN